MTLQLRQDIARVRLSLARAAELSAVDVIVHAASSTEPARLLADDFPLDELERLARAEHTALADRLPAPLRPGLVTEAGALEQTVREEGRLLARRAVRYIISSCRGVVFGNDVPATGGEQRHGPPPWTGTVEVGALRHDLPVVLAPAAVLALVMHLDAAEDGAPEALPPMRGRAAALGVVVVRETASPYPPHTSPVDLIGTRQLQHEEPTPPPSRLRGLFRPEWWSRPAGALVEDTVGSILVSCDMTGAAPALFVLIEELVPVSPRPGRGRWLARAALGTTGDRLASGHDLVLDIDPLRILHACCGALGGVQVAVVGNPLAGDRYGFAPFVLLSQRLTDLVG